MSKFKTIAANKFKAITLTIVVGLTSTNTAFAQDYTIQVGAYKFLSQRIINKAERYGQVFQSRTPNDLTRIQIGSFDSRSQAKPLLTELKVAGYRDAFITILNQRALDDSSTAELNTYNYADQAVEPVQEVLSPKTYTFDSLTDAEKEKATFLDNELRIFENGEFMTVSQYRNLR